MTIDELMWVFFGLIVFIFSGIIAIATGFVIKAGEEDEE